MSGLPVVRPESMPSAEMSFYQPTFVVTNSVLTSQAV